jgi:Fe-S oxidoreductase
MREEGIVGIEDVRQAVYRCHHCRACSLTDSDEIGWHRVCPTYEAYPFEHYAAGGRIAIARAWLEELIQKPEEVVESIFSCLGCGACKEICQAYTEIAFPLPDGIDTPRIMRLLRQELAARGLAPKIIKSLDQGVKKTNNAFGGNQAAKKALAEQFNLPARGSTLFFSGCYTVFGKLRQVLENSIRIFKETGTEPAYLADQEWCCGILQYVDGNMELCRELVLHNLNAIQSSGASTVVTTCAGCYHAIKHVYPKIAGIELPFKVSHTSEYLSQLLQENKLKFKKEVQTTVTYHDPCHLGRLCKVYEEPRTVISRIPGITLLEMERNREKAWCCGGGEGIVSAAYPQLASMIGDARIREAKATGATAIITTCPHCITMLNLASQRLNTGLMCMDLSEIVFDALGLA